MDDDDPGEEIGTGAGMRGRSIGFGLALLVACAGCGRGDGGKVGNNAAQATGHPSARRPDARSVPPATPPEAALTFDHPGDARRRWIAVSLPGGSDDGGEGYDDSEDSHSPAIFRLRGDAFSKYYYVEESDIEDIRNEEGRLLAHIARQSDNIGARKTAARTALYFYFQPEDRLPNYDLVVIERGAARVYRCAIDQATLEIATGKHFATRAALVKEQYKFSNPMVNLLQDNEPALIRDHCVEIDNGVQSSGEALIQPALRIPFPHIGDVTELDDRGLKSGWLALDDGEAYGPGAKACCAFTYMGEDRDAYIIAHGPSPRHGEAVKWRVSAIFYVEPTEMRSFDCLINGVTTIVAVADAKWRNGRAYLYDGKAVRIVHWKNQAPAGCTP